MRNGTMRAFAALVLALSVGACAGKAPPGQDDDDTTGPDGGDDHFPDASVPSTPDAAIEACAPSAAGTITFQKVATWKDDAKAAYSFIHDDMCDYSVRGIYDNAFPQMVARGIHGGIGVISGSCGEDDGWAKVAEEESKGMEIVNHSYTHPNILPDNMQHEVGEAKSLLDQHLTHPATFFIFPYDFFSSETIAKVKSVGHLGSRSGIRDGHDGFSMPPIASANPDDDYAVVFDVWPRAFSKYALYYPEDVLQEHAWKAINSGGWAMRELHSVMADAANPAENGFGPVPISIYTKHLDFLQKAVARNYLWVGTPSEVIRYRHARTACKASVNGTTIKFDAASADCQKYATPISVIVKTANDIPRLDGKQAGNAVYTRKIAANTFSVDADPTKGDVELSGCSNDGPIVDTTPMDPEPQAAASVCDIQKIVGTGSNGKMDDLQRPLDEFQLWPNTSQADGRDGSWSGYPGSATIQMESEGTNNYVHFAGTGLNAYAGVTLGFVNPNGAGACYDAHAYHGIRFKIKGSVTDSMYPNQVFISLVAASTQSRAYGGDNAGEGGHWNKVVTVSSTSTFQTVTINWADFQKPTWGNTTSQTTLPVDQLQAIDFGIQMSTTAFDLKIDDIELF